MDDTKLRPLSGQIKVVYTINERPEFGEKTGIHRNYEDFGEWICRQFGKITIKDISDK